MIAYGIHWPSIAKDSQLLRERIAVAQELAWNAKLKVIRRNLWAPLERAA